MVNENIRLELTSAKHALQLFNAIENSRAHLSEFLPWVDNIQSDEDLTDYLINCELLHQQKKEVSFVIFLNDNVVGRIGLHHLNMQNKVGAIGYWLTKSAEGKGVITNACKALIDYGFQDLNLHRIEIKAAVTNFKSQAIPVKLNFRKEGILRQAEFLNNQFVDLILYSMLADEWKLNKPT
ncbi:MAG TPA: GNAT family protein, partial [Daejeonella sp.]|nr:GNAT family protein [Daejeonella sp.]